jgi:ABC-type antimicrobial peptide transport system permease subunit
MKIYHVMQESVQALKTNKLRSSLTVIGIIVGIFSVTAMLALGAGLSQNVLGRISSFSQGDVSISGALNTNDLAWVSSQPYVEAAMGSLSIGNATVIAEGQDYNVSVRSVLGDLAAVQPFTPADGTMFDFTDPEYNDRVVLATTDFNDKVVTDTGHGLVGSYISADGQQYQVIGLMKVATAGFSQSDGTIYIPYRTAVGTLTDTSNFGSIGVKLKDSSYFDITGKNLLEGLNASRYLAPDSTDLFRVSSAQAIIESAQQTTAMISLFLGIVGGIALFVGGIGTMNMMLTTVTERTKEIGLRKAIGARRRDILLQILFESVFLTLIGGAIGIGLTAVLAVVANRLLAGSNTISVIVSSQVVLFATVVAIVVGVVFGLYPANRASKLLPIDALRSE